MAGGTFTTQNKVRPGVYVNFASAPAPVNMLGERGITTMALQLPWGPAKQVIEINAGDDVRELLGYDMAAPELLLVREALKRARTLLLYRLNTGTKATATAGAMTITAQHGGTRGNDVSVVIRTNVDDDTLYDVVTMVAGHPVDTQTAATIEELRPNAWVTFAGTGDLAPEAGVALTGGDDGTVTNGDHSDYHAAIETYEFNTIGLTSEDNSLKALYAAFVRRLREEEGKKTQLVVENYPEADYEGVISVRNGVALPDGTPLTPAQAVAWVAGATAGAGVNQSLTYQAYDGAVDAAPRLTHAQTVAALKNGEFVFTPNNGRVVVEQDINTFTSFTPEKRAHFAKNRVIRVLDSIANDAKRIYETTYLGKVGNNDDGRNLFRNELVSYLNTLQGLGAIEGFDPETDIAVRRGEAADSVAIEVYVQPVDAVEKVYLGVEIE